MNLTNLRLYIPAAMELAGLRFDPAGDVVPNERALPVTVFIVNLHEDYKVAVSAHNAAQMVFVLAQRRLIQPANYADFARLFFAVQDTQVARLRHEYIAPLIFIGQENLQPLEKFCLAVLGHNDVTAVAIFAHFIANIKRKMLQLPVTYHIMPMLTGRQKGGKSTAVRKLLSPLGETMLETTITASLRPENFLMFSQYFAVFFDEMEGIQKSSISALKKMITEDRASGRLYYTQRNVSAVNRCSFIGTANDSALELIDDKTGARRFFELRCSDKLDWATLNGIDFVELWKGIDENKKSEYYLAAEAEIDRRQEDMVSIDMFKMFLQETLLNPSPAATADESTWVSSKNFYKIYMDWLEPYRATSLHPSTFFKKLAAAGFEKKLRHVVVGKRRTTLTVYRVANNSLFVALDAPQSVEERLRSKLHD